MSPLCLLLPLVLAQAYGQLLVSQQGDTCTPPCGAGECCVTHQLAMVSKRGAFEGSDLLGGQLYHHSCQPIKQQSQQCLLRNIANEWCDCAQGLTCTFNQDVALNNFFGVCQ